MTLWEYLNRVGERRLKLKELREGRPSNARLLANVIGCALVFGFLGAIVALHFIPVPAENRDLLTYMLGQLSGFAGGIVAYHYTLTAGQKELDSQKAENTARAFEAITAAVNGQTTEAPKGE